MSTDRWGKCLCGGWGTRGERPDVTFCDCPAGESLKRELPHWCNLANQMPAGAATLASIARDRNPKPKLADDEYQGEF